MVDILHHKAPSVQRLVNDLHAHGEFFPCNEPAISDCLCRLRTVWPAGACVGTYGGQTLKLLKSSISRKKKRAQAGPL
jgi:hypothetical protein